MSNCIGCGRDMSGSYQACATCGRPFEPRLHASFARIADLESQLSAALARATLLEATALRLAEAESEQRRGRIAAERERDSLREQLAAAVSRTSAQAVYSAQWAAMRIMSDSALLNLRRRWFAQRAIRAWRDKALLLRARDQSHDDDGKAVTK